MADEEVDKIDLQIEDTSIDNAIDKLQNLEDKIDDLGDKKIDITDDGAVKESAEEAAEAVKKAAEEAAEAVDEAVEDIGDDVEEVDKKLKNTSKNISKSGTDIKDVFKKATLTILGTAAAIGLASKKLNQMKGDAISAGISVQSAQVGGGIFESAGVDPGGFTSGIARLRDIKASAALGRLDPEFARRASMLGVGADKIRTLTPEQLADAFVLAAERKVAQSPKDLDVIRNNLQVVLGEEFTKVFDFNQAMGRSWDELKKEFQKYSFISAEATESNAEFAKEFQKTATFLQSFGAELTASFADDFRGPLEDFNTALSSYTEQIIAAIKFATGGTRAVYDEARSISARTFELAGGFDKEIGISLKDLAFLPASFAIAGAESIGLDDWFRSFENDSSTQSLQGMEKISNSLSNTDNSSVNSPNSSKNSITINGPLILIEGANPANLQPNAIANMTEKALRNVILPTVGVLPDAE